MSIETLIDTIMEKMSGLGKWQADFMKHILVLALSLRGRYTYSNLYRYGGKAESTYRKNYNKGFDFRSFQRELLTRYGGRERVWAFDPSYIRKSGKATPGVGYFWSGCAGAAKWGLEIMGLALLSIEQHTALHYYARQSRPDEFSGSLLSYYASVIEELAPDMLPISKLLAADAYFSKRPFVDAITAVGLDLISRFRDDVVLFYPYLGKQLKQRGRPRKYAGKVDLRNPDPQYFRTCLKDKNEIAYEARVYAKALKRWVKVVIVHTYKAGKIKRVKVFFSTQESMQGTDILLYYRQRFQIEFLYRDGKQHTGLEQSQSRKPKAMEFHYNLSLTAVSIAKVAHWLSIPEKDRKAFSMADVKTQYFNDLILDRFICLFAQDPNSIKNHPHIDQFYAFGKIAA